MAIAEAIDNAVNESQFVTVPILDARLAEFRADIRSDLSRQDHKIDTTRADLENKIDATRMVLENKIETTRVELDKKIDTTRVELEAKMDVGFATLQEKIVGVSLTNQADLQRTKAELVRWVFVAAFGNVGLTAAAVFLINALQHH